MPIVIKEIIVKTTVERVINRIPADEQLIRRIKEQVKNEMQEERGRVRISNGKNR